MSPKVTIVVGKNVSSSDGIAAANLAAAIANLAYSKEIIKVGTGSCEEVGCINYIHQPIFDETCPQDCPKLNGPEF